MIRLILLIFLAVFWALPGWAAVYSKDISGTVYYEDGATSCDDVTADDTSGDLGNALSTAGLNGTLYICPGTYSGAEIDTGRGLRTSNSGQTIEGIGTVILDSPQDDSFYRSLIAVVHSGCTITNISVTNGQYRGVFVGESNTTINNLIAYENGDGNGIYGTGLSLYKHAAPSIDNITVNDSIFHNNRSFGTLVHRFVTNVTYNRCTAYENAREGTTTGYHGFGTHPYPITYTTGWTLDAGTVYYQTHSSAEPERIRHNNDVVELTHNDGATTSVGVDEWDWDSNTLYINIGENPEGENIKVANSGFGPVTYNDCISYDNYDYGLYAENPYAGEGHGFAADDGAYDITYNRCIAYGNDGAGFSINGGEDIQLNNCISSGNTNHGVWSGPVAEYIIYNSTINGNTLDGISVFGGGSATVNNTIISNNTDYGFDGNAIGTFTEDYNLFYNNTTGDRDDIGTGSNSITGDPQFVNPTNNNFRLKSTSPAIDGGTTLSIHTATWKSYYNDPRCYGAACDIGADEFRFSQPLSKRPPMPFPLTRPNKPVAYYVP